MKRTLLSLCLLASAVAATAQLNHSGQAKTLAPKTLAPVFESPEAALIKPQKGHPQEADARRVIGTNSPAYLPHTGSPRILTILVNFADSAMAVNNPKAAFNEFFNAEGQLSDFGNGNQVNNGSVGQYFKDMSNGEFTPAFDVYGPVTVPNPMSYYGGTTKGGGGERSSQLIADALTLVADSIADETVYDSNGDGYLDCIYIVYAGPGENFGGGASTIWAKTSTVSGTFGQLKLGWYSMAGELSPYRVSQTNSNWMITGVGVTCHELSHALGLPDIYPNSASAHVDNQEMEYWDLMDGGEYVRNGYCPAAYTAWEKQQMGWPVDIQELTNTGVVTMTQTTEEGGTAYKISNPEQASEYFLLENIQKKDGQWNRYLPGHGLLVYHVNETGFPTIGIGSHLNNTAGRPGMAVVPADGACLSSYIQANDSLYLSSHRGDPFPGTSNVTMLTDTLGLPNFYWYYGSNTGATANDSYHRVTCSLYDITETDQTISFYYSSDSATGITGIMERRKPMDSRIYTIDGRQVGTSAAGALGILPKGIYIQGGRKITVK